MKKKLLWAMLLSALVLCGCKAKDNDAKQAANAPTASKKLIDPMLAHEGEVEVRHMTEHMNSYEASTSGNWEAMFVPIDDPGRAVDMETADLTPTAEELAAMKKEPAWGQDVLYYMNDGCTSGPTVAAHLGYYEEAGLTSRGFRGTSTVEALGTGKATVAVNHIATMLVPITNGVDLTFVGGAHIGCKSLYVLADSNYHTTQDLKGTSISVPNGIGNADYNITSMLLDADGINPRSDVKLTPITVDACVVAMERGEISAALLSDAFAYKLVKDGKLKCIRSLLDDDFAGKNCCVIAMNRTFVKQNPVISKKIVQAVQKAHSYMRKNPEEATKMLIEQGWNAGDYEMNVMLNNSLQFGVSDSRTQENLTDIINRYIRLGLITKTNNADEVMSKAWTPVQ